MTGALVIFVAMVVIGVLLYVTDVAYFRHHHPNVEKDKALPQPDNATDIPEEDICCGQHLVCEKTSLAINSDEIIYYDDEELDRFAGRAPSSYTFEETEEFRDVLMTLLPGDVIGWAKSITLRKIELPEEIRDELFMLVSEARKTTESLSVN